MRAVSDGFELVFTKPVNVDSASDPGSYTVKSHTYLYQSTYGSDEIQKRDLQVKRARVSDDGLRARLSISGLRELFVHELAAAGIRSRDGEPLLHPYAWYTLNHIPE